MLSAEHRRAMLAEARGLHRDGHRGRAAELFDQALAGATGEAEAWYEYGYLLKAEGRYADAQQAFANALANGIERAHEVHLNRALLYADHLRRDDAAQTELDAALALEPGYVPALLNLGNLYEQQGHREKALAAYQRTLSEAVPQDRDEVEMCTVALARSAIIEPPTTSDDPRLSQLQQALETIGPNPQVRATLLFSLAQCYDRLKLYDKAFDAFARGNRVLMRQSGRRYNRTHETALTDAMMAAFAEPELATGASAATISPLFICGMYRSGSTLIEQVLASHPQVVAGGEIDWFRRVAAERLAPFPASVHRLDAGACEDLASEYLAHVSQLFPNAQPGMYLTDKRPDNYQLIGLIKRLFPAAKIIHTTRDPIDTSLSVYMQHMNADVIPYANDLGDIGHYYGQYQRLMAHWQAQFASSIYEFNYDSFVRQPAQTLEGLLGFLGLAPDQRCMDFHTLRNTVKTASYWQVRRPLNDKSSGRWRNYRTHLRPLLNALAQAGVIEVVEHTS